MYIFFRIRDNVMISRFCLSLFIHSFTPQAFVAYLLLGIMLDTRILDIELFIIYQGALLIIIVNVIFIVVTYDI